MPKNGSKKSGPRYKRIRFMKEVKFNKSVRKKELNRKIRYSKDPLDAKYSLVWETMA